MINVVKFLDKDNDIFKSIIEEEKRDFPKELIILFLSLIFF